jgi:hypothetical protein
LRNFWGEPMTRRSIRRNFLFRAFVAIPVTYAVGVNKVRRAQDLTAAHLADVGLHSGMLIFFAWTGLFRDFPDD